jgi:hypothetical protein
VEHDSGTAGFTSEVAFLPNAGAGVVILANAGDADGLTQLAFDVLSACARRAASRNASGRPRPRPPSPPR